MSQCPFCSKLYPDAHRRCDKTQHENMCKSNPNRIIKAKRKLASNGWLGKKHSEVTKNKISESRTRYLIENPDKVPYVLNHYSKGESYPEKYFREFLEQSGVQFESEYRISIYRLDFAIIGNKIAIEIDGEQHYTDDRIIKSNIKRDEFLDSLGWTTIRIRWSHFKRLSDIEKNGYLFSLLEKIE